MLPCQKRAFYLPEDLHYINCAYMSPLARKVETAGIAGMRQKRIPSTIGPDDFFRDGETVRKRFAELIHVQDPQRIAILPSASYGIATVARNTPARRGQNIVVVREQFPSNVYTWRRMERDNGITVRTISPPNEIENRGEKWNERVLEAIDADTVLVAIGHVHWADGTRYDLIEIGRRARDVGAAFIIDGTQSVGALPIDVEQISPDALICAGYKWLLGPYSIGLGYFGPRYNEGIPLEENWISRLNSEIFSELVNYQDQYQPGAIRFDVGERSNFILLPMMNAGLKLIATWGVSNIQHYCASLIEQLLQSVQEAGFWVENSAWRGAHLFGIRMPNHMHINTVKRVLAENKISVSVRGSAVRIAPNVYNDEADMAALQDALLSI